MSPKLTPEQKDFVAKAKEYGKAAFQKGHIAPYLDKDFMTFLNSVANGLKMSHVRTAIYKGWYKGKAEAGLEEISQ